jgi:putative Mg2+ transporter-C (MgtC) family protein
MTGMESGFLADGALVRMLLAILLGGLVGLEREIKGRPAGLRTHVLVCLGSTILLIAAHGAGAAYSNTGHGPTIVLDPNRISAGIVTGIGVLGAGAILRTGDLIRGLTTGATIWFVAALGIVIGSGAYWLAITSTICAILVLEVFDYVGHRIPAVIYRSLHVRIAAHEREAFEAWCREYLKTHKFRLQEVLCRLDLGTDFADLTFRIRARVSHPTSVLITAVSARPGVREVGMGQE